MQHGGDLGEAMARYGGERADWLDLSTGINPHPYPLPAIAPRFWQALPNAADAAALLAAARIAYEVPDAAGIAAAPGTQALIQWLPRLAVGGEVAIPGPTYAEHALAWRAAGFRVREIADLTDLPEDARHLVLVNPNNPDGGITPLAEIEAVAGVIAARGGWVIVDESFADTLVSSQTGPDIGASALVERYPVLVLRSFGKFYGLAGVRLGFLIAGKSVAESVSAALGPWSVAGPALALGTAALADLGWRDAMREKLAGEAERLDTVLRAGGLEIAGGTSLFRLARTLDAQPLDARPLDAHVLHARLASRRIWVRRFDWDRRLLRFGLPPDEAALLRLARALEEARHG